MFVSLFHSTCSQIVFDAGRNLGIYRKSHIPDGPGMVLSGSAAATPDQMTCSALVSIFRDCYARSYSRTTDVAHAVNPRSRFVFG